MARFVLGSALAVIGLYADGCLVKRCVKQNVRSQLSAPAVWLLSLRCRLFASDALLFSVQAQVAKMLCRCWEKSQRFGIPVMVFFQLLLVRLCISTHNSQRAFVWLVMARSDNGEDASDSRWRRLEGDGLDPRLFEHPQFVEMTIRVRTGDLKTKTLQKGRSK